MPEPRLGDEALVLAQQLESAGVAIDEIGEILGASASVPGPE